MAGGYGFPQESLGGTTTPKESALKKAADAASGIATEALQGQMSQLAKRHLFSPDCQAKCPCKSFANITNDFLKRKQNKAATA